MKRYLSVLALAARSTIYKIAGVFLLMAAAEAALFALALRRMDPGLPLLLEEAVAQSRISFVCAATFFALCAVLCFPGFERAGNRPQYSLRRLLVREETTVTLWAGYYMICFLLFWAVQLGVILLLCRMYLEVAGPSYPSDHTVFLAFYRNDFLHSLLPMEETSRYVRNGFLILGLGLSCASFSLGQRRGQRDFLAPVLAVITATSFAREIGRFGSDLLLSLIALAAAIRAVYTIWRRNGHEQ